MNPDADKSEGRNPKFERNPKPEARRNLADRAGLGAWRVRIWDFGLPSAFGFRVSDFCRDLAATLATLATLAASAAIPAPEQLLPDDTLILLTAPDFTRLRQICLNSPRGQLWSDPAMKPLKDKFLSRWTEEVVKPLERDLNLSLDTYASLVQGQLTFAVTKNAWQGRDNQPLGFLILLDTRDKAGLLKTNLTELRTKWVRSGKTLKTEKIRNLEFSVFPVTTNDVPKTLSKFLWRSPVFAQVSGAPEYKQAPVAPSAKSDLLLDLLVVLLTASKELVIGQVDSLLVVGNSTRGLEQVVTRLTGGAMPVLGDVATYQASHQALFRDTPFYGWMNVKAFVDGMSHKPSEAGEPSPADPLEPIRPDQLISAIGLAGCKTLAFNLQDSHEGSLVQIVLSVPETARQGIFPVLFGPAKEANPPPFVPADAAQFFRWRTDGPKAWATIEKALNDLSPQALSTVNLILDTAGARARQTDPGFDLRKTLLANLGDDIVSYEKGPRGNRPAELESPPYLFLLGSPNPEQLAVALKRLFVIFPQGDAPAEREFLGRKIFSVPVPPLPFLTAGASRSAAARILSCAASGGYVAMSTDTSLLEEYLRSSESQAKALREKPGLLDAAQKVGGMGTGLFNYEDEAGTMRAAFETAKNSPWAATNGIGPSILPGLPGIAGPEQNLKEWLDFSLLPAFDKIARYFYFSLYAGNANVDGLTLKVFTPTPPALRTNPPPAPGAPAAPTAPATNAVPILSATSAVPAK